MKKNIIYIIAVLGGLLLGCAEDKGNYTYSFVNELKITGISKDTSVLLLENLKMTPVFDRSLTQSEEGLEYSWTMAGKEICTTRNLDYVIPADADIGKYDCRYIVRDTKNGMCYYFIFNMNITSSFGWGYYFLCEGENKETILSYFSSKEGTTDCIHTNKIGAYSLGSEPKTIVATYGNVASLGSSYYMFYVVSSKGEYPIIGSNNGSFMPSELINSSSFIFGDEPFSPTDGCGGGVFYISNGKIYFYNRGVMYRAAKHNKEYKWSNPISYSGVYGVFAFDEISKKFYVLANQVDEPALGLVADKYAWDRVIEIKDQPDYSGQTIISKSVIVDGDAYSMGVAMAEAGKINLVHLNYIDIKPASGGEPAIVDKTWFAGKDVLPLAAANADTKAVLLGNDWYFVAGNKVYISPVLLPVLSEFVDLPLGLGMPVSMAVSSKGTDLIIATYDSNSTHVYKGSFVVINLQTKKVKAYPNVMGKCVEVKGFDAQRQ